MSSHRVLRSAGSLLIALFLLASPFLASTAFAEREAGSFGGPGGAPFHGSCTPKALAGVFLFAGTALDKVMIDCGTLHENGTVTDVRGHDTFNAGGGGGTYQIQACPPNALVTGMRVWKDHNNMVNSFVLRCTYMTNGIETWTTMQAGGEAIDDPVKILCKKNEIGIGIYGQAGSLIDKIGLLCADNPMKVASAPPPPPPPCPEGQVRVDGNCQAPMKPIKHTGKGGGDTAALPSGVLSCQGGGGMRMTSSSQTTALIAFTPAAQPANVAPPGPGECAWSDRTFGEKEPHQLGLVLGKPNTQRLLDAMRGGTFQVSARPSIAFIMVTAIGNVQVMDSTPLSPGPVTADSSNDAGSDETPQTPADMGGMPAEQADSGTCRGTATIVINQPGLDKLNVRSGPGGQVVGTVPEGDTVSVIGPCGSTAGAAGFAKPKTQGGGGGGGSAGGWCQIGAPVHGCVMSQFLDFGGGDVGTGLPNGAAGFAKSKGKQPTMASASASFGGRWSSNADDVSYSLSLKQNGSGVSGSFKGSDGSVGTLSGQLSGNVLRFSWQQTDGTKGNGKFVLSGDGKSFEGSYSVAGDSSAGGSWNGTRQ